MVVSKRLHGSGTESVQGRGEREVDETVQHPTRWEGAEATHSFGFTGRAGEYFGIWIVNLLLSIVTLGIYTAWAKVRRLRYFYGNTWLDGHNFEYHARPMQILIGRLIVMAVLAIYFGLNFISPAFGVLVIPYLIAFPWLLNKSMAFNARMTSYRNVRFNFRGSYWGAFGAFIAAPMLTMFSLGIAAPVASQMSSNYIGKHLGYGTARFKTDAPMGKLYRNFGMTIVFAIAVGLVAGALAFAGGFYAMGLNTIGTTGTNADLAKFLEAVPGIVALLAIYITLILAILFYMAGVRNVAFNATRLDAWYRLTSDLGRGRYVWILVSNLFASIFTIGLLRPWAAIRTWRYFAAHTALLAEKDLDGFADEAAPEGNVAAAEFFDIEGIDIGL